MKTNFVNEVLATVAAVLIWTAMSLLTAYVFSGLAFLGEHRALLGFVFTAIALPLTARAGVK